MKIVKVFIYLVTLILINSCSLSKAAKYFKEGKTEQENYKVTFPFEMEKGWIIVPVEIKNKTYRFLLDTGTPTLVSKELAESLNMKVIDSVNASDVYNKSQQNKYARIETIGIGTIDFIETVALINDFNATPMWASLNVDGFIGASLMQHAVWDIDFDQKQITITDNESKLNLPKEVIENKLFIGVAGLPSIAAKINGEKIWNFPVDLGYNGDIVIPFSEFKKQTENGEISDFKKLNTQSVGIYGKENAARESYTGIINEIGFGNSTLKNEKVYSEQYLSRRFGLDFFRNYRVILNWDSKKIKLIESKETTDS
ncbi:retropepsin-like aspartic protease [Salinimicrobium sediminilitoris]|uniref:retropepsin-like aspartic protease n=1 Tax=Salinimicrobium sediminilitoris TaxID=2876715 RepID=UPI001E433792|nr:retropepsin-like aspartic protease [Salinimicrobium sediminilitoris]MCC8358924.1 retroviral-like aspartic protease family protein [Salinimicrobium sediminilitoris]